MAHHPLSLLSRVVVALLVASCAPQVVSDGALDPDDRTSQVDGGAPELDGGAPTGDDEGERDAGTPDAPSACAVDLAIAGCAPDGQGDLRCTLEHDGRARTYLLHAPPAREGARSLVFAFHGLRTTASLQRWISNMNAAADAHGYAVVYPEGVGTSALDQSFNAGLCCGAAQAEGVDDVGFTLAILDALRAPLCVDASAVYATGLSNGGHMAYRLACERADVFAAVAPVAGLVTVASCAPSRPVSILHFHGTDDAIVGYGGGIDGVTGAVATVERWAERDGCASASEVTYEHGEATCAAYPGCQGGADVELCTIDGGGHTWPGGEELAVLGHTTSDLDATERISLFFAAHRLP